MPIMIVPFALSSGGKWANEIHTKDRPCLRNMNRMQYVCNRFNGLMLLAAGTLINLSKYHTFSISKTKNFRYKNDRIEKTFRGDRIKLFKF